MSNIDKLDMSKGPSSKAIAKMLRTSPIKLNDTVKSCLLYTSPSPRDRTRSRMPSSA